MATRRTTKMPEYKGFSYTPVQIERLKAEDAKKEASKKKKPKETKQDDV